MESNKIIWLFWWITLVIGHWRRLLGVAGPARIADAIEEDVSVAVGGVVVRVLASLAAGVVEGVVELESRFELARYGLASHYRVMNRYYLVFKAYHQVMIPYHEFFDPSHLVIYLYHSISESYHLPMKPYHLIFKPYCQVPNLYHSYF